MSSLIKQTLQPYEILLNISEEPHGLDEGIRITELPPLTSDLIRQGIVTVSVGPNTGPYRKLIPALRRYDVTDNILIATIDDDVFYPPHWLAALYAEYKIYRCICAYRCRHIRIEEGHLRPYRDWSLIERAERIQLQRKAACGQLYLPTGKGGVLYHPSFFCDLSLLHKLALLAPTNDDLGLRFATFPMGIRVRIVDYRSAGATSLEFPGRDIGPKLWDINKDTNDRMLATLWSFLVEAGYLENYLHGPI